MKHKVIRLRRYLVEKIWQYIEVNKNIEITRNKDFKIDEVDAYKNFDEKVYELLQLLIIKDEQSHLELFKEDTCFEFMRLNDITYINELCIKPYENGAMTKEQLFYQSYLYILNCLLKLDDSDFLMYFSKLFIK